MNIEDSAAKTMMTQKKVVEMKAYAAKDIYKNTKEAENLVELESAPGDGTFFDPFPVPNKTVITVWIL